jgi:hypothetical protein
MCLRSVRSFFWVILSCSLLPSTNACLSCCALLFLLLALHINSTPRSPHHQSSTRVLASARAPLACWCSLWIDSLTRDASSPFCQRCVSLSQAERRSHVIAMTTVRTWKDGVPSVASKSLHGEAPLQRTAQNERHMIYTHTHTTQHNTTQHTHTHTHTHNTQHNTTHTPANPLPIFFVHIRPCPQH